MITSPRPSTSTTAPCGPFSASSRFMVPAAVIWASSSERVARSVIRGSYLGVRRPEPPLLDAPEARFARFQSGGYGRRTPRSLVVVLELPAETHLGVHVEDHAGVDGTRIDVH